MVCVLMVASSALARLGTAIALVDSGTQLAGMRWILAYPVSGQHWTMPY